MDLNIKIKKKIKIIKVLHQCTKNYDHDHMFGCRDMAWDKQTGYFRMIFAFYPCSRSKNQNFKNYKKNTWYIMILHLAPILDIISV